MKKIFTILFCICMASASQAQVVQLVNDPSFETGNPNGGPPSAVWNDSIYDPTPTGCILDYPAGAHTGNKLLSMIVGPGVNGGIAQQLIYNTKERYNCKLEFWIKNELSSGSSLDVFFVLHPSIYSTTGLASDCIAIGNTWKKITAFTIDTLPPTPSLFKFQWERLVPSNIAHTLYYIDDITLTCGYPLATKDITMPNAINILATIVTNELNIELNNKEKYTTVIYNTTGQLVQQNILNLDATQQINIQNLVDGNYFIAIKDAKNAVIQTSRFIKQ
jgi:Secretion system C-terminal sorting domain